MEKHSDHQRLANEICTVKKRAEQAENAEANNQNNRQSIKLL